MSMKHPATDESQRDPESAVAHDDSPHHINPMTSESIDLLKGSALLAAQETPQQKLKIRLVVFAICLIGLVLGRAGVPSNDPPCVVDRLMDLFQFVNDFIINNHGWRNGLQIACSVFMDVMFLATGALWILKGTTSRPVLTLMVFYIVRAIVQNIWLSPFPAQGEYWWYDPGLPSLVVPYGKGSDFFFSGHVGFVTICACEWNALGKKMMVYILTVGGIYTGFILMAYHVHYSIDIFTGAIFAHWVFMMVDHHKEKIDNMFFKIYYGSLRFFKRMIGTHKD